MIDGGPELSFVLPAFNEAGNVEPMTERLCEIGESLGGSYEIIWIDDGSSDNTADALDKLAQERSQVEVIHFSRNFGHMAALTAGLERARGEAVVCLDGDGQHPPEVIPALVDEWRQGADIVQAIRTNTTDGWLKQVTSIGFYRVFNLLCELDMQDGSADFRLMDREAVDALNALPESVRFVRGLVSWLGFTRSEVAYAPAKRMSGTSKYGLLKMCAFALGGITSFSVRPLRLAFLLAVLVLAAAALYGVYVVICYVGGKEITPGWTSMLFATMTLGGAQLLVISIASEYLGRIYAEVKRRPIYLARKARPTNADRSRPKSL